MKRTVNSVREHSPSGWYERPGCKGKKKKGMKEKGREEIENFEGLARMVPDAELRAIAIAFRSSARYDSLTKVSDIKI